MMLTGYRDHVIGSLMRLFLVRFSYGLVTDVCVYSPQNTAALKISQAKGQDQFDSCSRVMKNLKHRAYNGNKKFYKRIKMSLMEVQSFSQDY